MSSHDDPAFGPSKVLLSAALGGLLCVASITCAGTNANPSPGGDSSASTGTSASTSSVGSAGGSSPGPATGTTGHTSVTATSGAGGASNATATASATTAVTATAAGTGGAGAGTGGASTASAGGAVSTSTVGGAPVNGDTPQPDTECDGGVSPDPAVTSSTVEALTQQQFMDLCSQANGIFEIQPHCGGSNACRGFSYESDTQTLTQHTCRATNQCHGYSCVVCS